MNRQPILKLLTTYLTENPQESEVTNRFIDFVKANSDCFERSLLIGHVTGSAWVVNEAGTHVLLTHHKKLNKWFQLGGHADGESDILKAALTEVDEESGLADFAPISTAIFDIDIHAIPARKDEPEHDHYDVRFAVRSMGADDYVVSEESHDLSWVEIKNLGEYTQEESMLRMGRKWLSNLVLSNEKNSYCEQVQMTNIEIQGGKPLSGRITISGNKNALLPMVCGSLLTSGPVEITNVPKISDGLKILDMFKSIGSDVAQDESSIKVNHLEEIKNISSSVIPVGIRSAVLLFSPIIYRTGRFEFDQDAKGCALGVREIDPHLEVLKSFGCDIAYNGQKCVITCLDGFKGADVWLDYQSVTATETFLMAAVVAKGESRLTNAACEPHVKSFCDFLTAMGAKISGAGTSILTVEGVEVLSGASCRVPDDHHEAATYAAIGASTGGILNIETHISSEMKLIVRQFQKVGLNVSITETGLVTGPSSFRVQKNFTPEVITKVEAAPWPYFPADILPQIIGASIQSEGEILYWNKVYEGALFWSSELQKFGARVHLSDPHRLVMIGSGQLRPATVEAPYIIRVVLGLVIAALQIPGRSVVKKASPIARAHPDFIEKLQSLGADIRWIED